MVYSVKKGHKGKPYLNGKFIDHAFLAATIEGVICKYKMDEDDKHIVSPCGTKLETERLYGRVTYGPHPSDPEFMKHKE